MAMLFKVVERILTPDRRNLVSVGGIWYEDLDVCRRMAAGIAATTLAHRLYIVNSVGLGKGLEVVFEEVELAPLAQRLAALHAASLAIRNPARLEAERRAIAELPEWRRRLPLLQPR